MTQQERLEEILLHLRAAAALAENEANYQKEQKQEFRPAAQQVVLEDISSAFNGLTTNLLYAGMSIHPANEVRIRMSNAINAVLANPL